jgi:hypothetical protein
MLAHEGAYTSLSVDCSVQSGEIMAKEHFTDPGYNQEDAYFDQNDLDLLATKRARLDAHRAAYAPETMECPRCGSPMTEVGLEQVKIDRCTNCGGVFLDKGELEILTHAKSGGLFRRLSGG